MNTMKAVYFAGPNVSELREFPVPVPGRGEILLKVAACGVCHTDILMRDGIATHMTYPFIPGHEYTGTVVAVGEGVERLKVGDRGVAQQIIPDTTTREFKMARPMGCCPHREMGCELDGGMAEYCVMPERNLLLMPDGMTFREGTFVEPMANAYCAMTAGDLMPMDTVVVVGPGPIGICACKIASILGAGKVILVGTRDSRLKLARENNFGVDYTVNITEPGAEEYLKRDLLGGRGADIVMEAAGTVSALELSFRLIGKGSRLVCEGMHGKDNIIPFCMLMLPDNSSLHRVSAWTETEFYNCLQFIATRKIDVNPLITHAFPLTEWESAFDMAVRGKDEAMKVVLVNE